MQRELEPAGEALRRAVRWIGEERKERPREHTATLIDEASKRFDLTPAEEEFLYRALTLPV